MRKNEGRGGRAVLVWRGRRVCRGQSSAQGSRLGLKFWGSRCRVHCLRCRAWGSGFGVWDFKRPEPMASCEISEARSTRADRPKRGGPVCTFIKHRLGPVRSHDRTWAWRTWHILFYQSKCPECRKCWIAKGGGLAVPIGVKGPR